MPSFSPKNEKEIALADIAKCKGSVSIAGRLLGQMQVLWRTGHFVTDQAVSNFILNHSGHLDEISTAFKSLSAQSDVNIDAKQLGKDQAIARRLAKVFARGSFDINLENDRFNTDMQTSYVGFNTLKTMDGYDLTDVKDGLAAMSRFDPVDLIRAAAYEKMKDKEPKDDLKSHFVTFLKGKDIKDEEGLVAAYKQFINEIASSQDPLILNRIKKYPEDTSTELFKSKYENFKSKFPKKNTSESEFEVDFENSSSTFSQVKEMGVEELLVNIFWGLGK